MTATDRMPITWRIVVDLACDLTQDSTDELAGTIADAVLAADPAGQVYGGRPSPWPATAGPATAPATPGETLDLDAIEARAEAATPGPWAVANDTRIVRGLLVTGRGSYTCIQSVAEINDVDDRCDWGSDEAVEVEPEADAEFIAAARQDVPLLLAELRRLRGERQVLTDRWGHYKRHYLGALGEAERLRAELDAARATDPAQPGDLREEVAYMVFRAADIMQVQPMRPTALEAADQILARVARAADPAPATPPEPGAQIVTAAIAYVDAPEDSPECEQRYDDLEEAVRRYRAEVPLSSTPPAGTEPASATAVDLPAGTEADHAT